MERKDEKQDMGTKKFFFLKMFKRKEVHVKKKLPLAFSKVFENVTLFLNSP